MKILTTFRETFVYVESWNSSFSIVTGYGLDVRGSFPNRAGFFSSPQCPDWLWGPPSLPSNGHQGSFFGSKVFEA
jgi:hypothetical protein